MFISTYSTYINTNTSEKTHKYKEDRFKVESEPFAIKESQEQILKPAITKNLPVDYVFNNKSFNNQLKLQEQLKNPDEIKFKKIKTINSAKEAYEENSKLFHLFKKPSSALSKPLQLSKELPQEIQQLKESNLRHIMIDTYVANDRYYQVTAA